MRVLRLYGSEQQDQGEGDQGQQHRCGVCSGGHGLGVTALSVPVGVDNE